MEMHPLSVFGAKPRPDRLQEGPSTTALWLFGALLAENGAPGSHFGVQPGSKIGQKSTPNRSRITPWRGSRFCIIFCHMLDPRLDPVWINFRSQNDIKNMSKITCKIDSKKVRLWTFQVTLLGSIFAPNAMYFPNAFQASMLSVRFTCFLHLSNCWTLKKTLYFYSKTRVSASSAFLA